MKTDTDMQKYCQIRLVDEIGINMSQRLIKLMNFHCQMRDNWPAYGCRDLSIGSILPISLLLREKENTAR